MGAVMPRFRLVGGVGAAAAGVVSVVSVAELLREFHILPPGGGGASQGK